MNIKILKVFLTTLLGVILSLGLPLICSAESYFYSFETDMQNWATDGTDLSLGDGTIDWHILRSTQQTIGGTYSLEFYLSNLNDGGKIWIEKAFLVSPNTSYKVTVSYKFASNDWGDMGNFRLITGVSNKNPETREDLTFQGDTYNGGTKDFTWLDKSYNFNVKSDWIGKLYVAVGIWGTFEVSRTYYFDAIHITINQE